MSARLVAVVGVVDDLPSHGEVVVGQHHPLRRPRRAGGVNLSVKNLNLKTTFFYSRLLPGTSECCL